MNIITDNQNHIIAELAGIHNGEKNYILSLIKDLQGNTDGIKFQPYNYDTISLPEYEHRDLLKKVTGNIKFEDWNEILQYANKLDLKIWIDIHDIFSLKVFKENKDIIYGIKIPVGNLNNMHIIENIYEFEEKKIIINFAGFDDKFIEDCINEIALDHTNIILQVGVQNYPTKIEDSNISRIHNLKSKFKCLISYADHISYHDNDAIHLSKYAYFAGATFLEKHVCLEHDDNRPDYYSSLDITNFKKYYNELKYMEIINGTNSTNSDSILNYLSNLNVCPVLLEPKKKNDIITYNDFTCKRINSNIDIKNFNEQIPGYLLEDYNTNEKLSTNHIKKISITAVIVARFKSTRLPGKCLKKLNNVESIIRCIRNAKNIKYIKNVVLATSDNDENKPLIEIAKKEDIDYYIGTENNLLDRYIGSGEQSNSEHIIRITGDCPCISYEIANILINNHITSGADNTLALPGTYSIGTACEVYKLSALKKLKSKLPIEGQLLTEYLTLFMVFNPKSFKVEFVKLPKIFTKYVNNIFITLDTEDDYKLINDIYTYNNITNDPLSFNDINNYFINNRYIQEERQVSVGDEKKKEDLIKNFNKYCNIDKNFFIPFTGNHYEQMLNLYNKKK